jgi:2-succinyl-5-enolpyruvyl-6-hydroxy-3-cyclohexene-1-carboxylate synthase
MSGALLTEWSRLLVASLCEAGVRDAVICPGSRSTPFAWALAADDRLRCHSLIDERVAAFFALGLARASGQPALVLSTSGSAAANFFSAVVEASLSHTPLVVLTADRPLEMQQSMAAQTIDQVKLYGDHARAYFDLGAPEPSLGALAGLRRAVVQAVATARAPLPGPVHLNARARKPLEPIAPGPADAELTDRVRLLLSEGVTRVVPARPAIDADAVRDLAATLAQAERGVIVCGPMPLAEDGLALRVQALSRRLGFPVYAEATSQLRFTKSEATPLADGFDWLLSTRAFSRSLAPDTVLRLGATPTSSALERWLGGTTEAALPALHVVAEHGHSDPSGRARTLLHAPPRLAVDALLDALGDSPPLPAAARHAARLSAANAVVWQAVERVLERSSATGAETSEPQAVRAVLTALPEHAVLTVGNSLPVRELDAYARAGSARVRVASQRGANGIDGLVSGAAGTAFAAGVPSVLLLGDVSLAHDLGGLAAARLVKTPFVIVVLDNDGGRIFEALPVARLFPEQPERAALWLTPPGLDLSHAAATFGLPYVAPASAAELRAAVEAALDRPGPTLVHARVQPTSARDTARAVFAELEAALAAPGAVPEA